MQFPVSLMYLQILLLIAPRITSNLEFFQVLLKAVIMSENISRVRQRHLLLCKEFLCLYGYCKRESESRDRKPLGRGGYRDGDEQRHQGGSSWRGAGGRRDSEVSTPWWPHVPCKGPPASPAFSLGGNSQLHHACLLPMVST